jgi:hypothetical protein
MFQSALAKMNPTGLSPRRPAEKHQDDSLLKKTLDKRKHLRYNT